MRKQNGNEKLEGRFMGHHADFQTFLVRLFNLTLHAIHHSRQTQRANTDVDHVGHRHPDESNLTSAVSYNEHLWVQKTTRALAIVTKQPGNYLCLALQETSPRLVHANFLQAMNNY
jgi:hypothetical protein